MIEEEILTKAVGMPVRIHCCVATAKNSTFIPLTHPDITAQMERRRNAPGADRSGQIGRALNDYQRSAQLENAAKNAPGFMDFIDGVVGELRSLAGASSTAPGFEAQFPAFLLRWVKGHVTAQTPEDIAAHEEAIKGKLRDYLGLAPDAPDHELLSRLEAAMQEAGVIDSPETLSADPQLSREYQVGRMKVIVAAYQARDGSPFHQAFQVAQHRHPFAFQNRARNSVVALSTADVLLSAQTQAEKGWQLRAAIARHQVQGVGFEEAFNLARAERPELF